MLVNSIDSLDLETSTVRFDIYLWLRWPNCSFDLDNDIFRPDLTFELDNGINRVDLTRKAFEDQPVCDSVPGYVYQQFRIEGQFLQQLDFRRYPLDSHTLYLAIEDSLYPRTTLLYVTDDIQPASNLRSTVKLPGWKVENFEVEENANYYDTRWGSVTPNYGSPVYSNYKISVKIDRGVSVYILRVLPPVIVTALIISIVFLLEVEETEARIAVISGGLLALIFLQLTFGQNLPTSVDYLTVVDWLLNSMYMLILGVLIETVVIRWVYHWLARRVERKLLAAEEAAAEKAEQDSENSGTPLSKIVKVPDANTSGDEVEEEENEEEEEEEDGSEDSGGGQGGGGGAGLKKRERMRRDTGSNLKRPTLIDMDPPRKGSLARLMGKFKKGKKGTKATRKAQKKVKRIHTILERVEKWLYFGFVLILALDVALVTVIARYA